MGGRAPLLHQLTFERLSVASSEITNSKKMAGDMIRLTLGVVCVVVMLLSLAELGEANYKNAPMNGIMFGKRGPTAVEYDNRGKAFTALCEIATEACQTWFPSPENK